ncbi:MULTISPECIES: PDR/VanB family oxidoreductase [unclassified Modestobacter]
MTVTALEAASSTVMSVTLAATDGGTLPSWDPGAHIDAVLPNGLVRQYSLCGDRAAADTYRVAVLRESEGRGGSAFVHTELAVGNRIEVRGPRNNFPLVGASAYRLVAGGIGITPLLPMVAQLAERRADWSLAYLGRSRETMAFLDELEHYGPERVTVIETGTAGRPVLTELIGPPRPDVAVYACGPESLLRAVEEQDAGWPPSTLHFERFSPRGDVGEARSGSFEVHLTEAGLTLQVPEEKSILDVVEQAGIPHPYSCREGTCGTCEVAIVDGMADHRDSILSPEEQEQNDTMMICVSRARTPRLDLEI